MEAVDSAGNSGTDGEPDKAHFFDGNHGAEATIAIHSNGRTENARDRLFSHSHLNAGTYTIGVRAVDNHNLAGPASSFAIAVGAGLAGTRNGLTKGNGLENPAVTG